MYVSVCLISTVYINNYKYFSSLEVYIPQQLFRVSAETRRQKILSLQTFDIFPPFNVTRVTPHTERREKRNDRQQKDH